MNKNDSFTATCDTAPPCAEHGPCCTGAPEHDLDHDWHYDGGDQSVGLNPAWVCRGCDATDTDREPPSYDDDY